MAWKDFTGVFGRRTHSANLACLAALAVVCLPACAVTRRADWQPPLLAPPLAGAEFDGGDSASPAEYWYAEAARFDEACSASAVDAYFNAAVASWGVLEGAAGVLPSDGPAVTDALIAELAESREWQLYHSAVAGLLTTAQRYGRWSPATGLLVQGPGGLTPVEVGYHGFVWSPAEFGALNPLGTYTASHLTRVYRRAGVGTALVVDRNDSGPQRPFIKPRRRFAATALVRMVATSSGWKPRLDFYDPLRESQVQLAGGPAPLAADVTAPLARDGVTARQAWLDPFLRPAGGGADDALGMLEPFQPNKIPVIFVHGLLSDPLVWYDMVNELQGQTYLRSRYQIWLFRYDTGLPFVTSAAVLRRQLAEVQALFNPYGADAAASNIVVVGHSMGGMVAKMQVTYSGDTLWAAAANVPIQQIRTDAASRDMLVDRFFFNPRDEVTRVVYIGTPHLGSVWARRAVGRIGSALVEPSPVSVQMHDQVVRDNPGVFSDEFTRRFPTSIDLLEPSSPLLNATARLPYRAGVSLHSIIGEGRYTVGSGPSDGIVPVSSACLLGVASDKFVDEKHSGLPRNDAVMAEVLRILAVHVQSVDGGVACPVAPASGVVTVGDLKSDRR